MRRALLTLCALVAFTCSATSQSAVLNGFPPGTFQDRAAIDGGSTAFTPASIPGLIAWHKADAGVYTDTGCSTPATDGQAVACWKDFSASGYDEKQTTSGNRPVYSATALDGKQGITLSAASSQWMASANGVVSLSGSNVSVFVVSKYTSNSGNFARWFCYGQPGAQDYQSGSFVYSRTNTTENIELDGSPGAFLGFGLNYNTKSFVAFVSDGTNATLYLNNVSQTSVAQANGYVTAGTFAISTLVTNGVPQGSNFLDGVISEIIVYNVALNSTQRGQIQTYLASRW